MDTKKFFSEIRLIIREEVDYAMNKYIDKQQKPKINEVAKVTSSKTQQPKHNNNIEPKTALQRIMEETRLAMANTVDVNMENIRENHNIPKPKITEPNFSQGINENTLLGVDYSKMLKKMEEKAKSNRPG
jgi:hypothetical protein